MKKRILVFSLALILALSSLVSCNSGNEGDTSATEPKATEPQATEAPTQAPENTLKEIKIGGTDISEYTVVIPEEATEHEILTANLLVEWIKEKSSAELKVVYDLEVQRPNEILIGNTNRAESQDAISQDLSSTNGFNVVLGEGYLAIAAESANGYLCARNSFIKILETNNYEITKSFSDQELSYDFIKTISVGSVEFATTNAGLKFYKCTTAQETHWASVFPSVAERARNTNGVRLDFETDSSSLYIEATNGNCVLLVNGQECGVQDHTFFYKIKESCDDEINRITVILPHIDNTTWALSKVCLDAGATVTPHEFDLNMLFLGDSITQGYNNHENEARTYTFYTSQYFNASSVVQGNGGARFDTTYIDPDLAFVPDVIIVAYGTNDWSAYRTKTEAEVKAKVDDYFTRLRAVYPDTPVIAITPIYRYGNTSSYNISLDKMRAIIEDVCADHNVDTVDGLYMVPYGDSSDRYNFFADDVHPNEDGFMLFGENLCWLIEDKINAIIESKKQ